MNRYIIASFIITLFLQTSVADVTKALDTLKHNIRQPQLDRHTLDLLEASPIFDTKNLNAKANKECRIETNDLFPGKSYDNLTIQFDRESPTWTVTWILAKYNDTNNTVMLSDNSGINTSEYDKFADYSLSSQIDDIFVNPANSKFVIFSDKLNKVLFISGKSGTDLRASQVSFEPVRFYFTHEIKIFAALDSQDQLWLTVNTGRSWKQISERAVIRFSDSVTVDERSKSEFIYFLEADARLIRFDLNGFQQDFINENVAEHRHVIAEEVSDFGVVENRVFVMRKSRDELELNVSNELSSEFELVDFEFEDEYSQLLDFQVTMVTEGEVFIGVTYKQQNNQIKNDIFVSVSKALKFIKFKPSLRNIINHCASSSNKTHTLDLNNNPCIEMRSLKTGYYLANAFNNQANRVETFVKRPSDSEWLPVSLTDSDDKQGLSLNLNDNFIQVHLEPEGSFNSDPSLPNVIVATAAKDVYLSSYEGSDWTRVDFGKDNVDTYIYSLSHEVMLAVDATKPVNKFLYSYDFGSSWHEYFFSDRLVFVNQIISDPSHDLNVFYLALTRANNMHSLVRIHFRPKQFTNFDTEFYDEPNPIPFDPSLSIKTTTTWATPLTTIPLLQEISTEKTDIEENLPKLVEAELVKIEGVKSALQDPVSAYYQMPEESRDQVIKVCLSFGVMLLVSSILVVVWTWLKNRKSISRYCARYYKEFIDTEQKVLKTLKKPIVKKEAEEYLIQKETKENRIENLREFYQNTMA